MKIYNKKRLWSGIGMLALAALLIVTMCIRGARAKSTALAVVMLVLGLSELAAALSRRQAIEDMEERSQYIEQKAKSRAFALTQNICLVLTVLLVVAGAAKDFMPLVAMGVATGLVFTLSAICEIGTTIYYESHC